MAEEKSLISVIIPVHNCERYLAEAIESVLAQTYRPIEIIVVDDGSTDGSAAVAREYTRSVQYCFQPRSGAGSARNRGVDLARGSLIAFLDADDLWAEEKLAHQMAAFDADPGLDMAFGRVKQFVSPELDVSMKRRLICPVEAMPGFVPGTMLIRRDAFGRVGRFEINWQVGEFIDWYLKAVEHGLKSSMLPQVMLRRRLHNANQGILERKSQVDYVRILKASLDRRRRSGLHVIGSQPDIASYSADGIFESGL